jgi:hypothetical protein
MFTAQTTLPALDQHPLMAKHHRQRQELDEALANAHTERARLISEREQLLRATFEGAVAHLLGDAGETVSPHARLVEIDAALRDTDTRLATIRAASERLQVMVEGTQATAAREVREQAIAAARVVVKNMLPLVAKLDALNEHLLALTPPAGGFGSLPIPFRPIVNTDEWTRRAQAFLDRGEQ